MQIFRLLKGLIDSTDKVEGVFRKVVVCAVEDLLAASECVFNGDHLTRDAKPEFSTEDAPGLHLAPALQPSRLLPDLLQ